MSHGRFALPLVLALLAPAPLPAEELLAPAEVDHALARCQALRWELGLDQQYDFLPLTAQRDELGQAHVRFQELFRGVPVFGGEAILHTDARGGALPTTDGLYRGLRLDVQPTLTPAEALARVDADLAPADPYAYPPVVERVVWPAGKVFFLAYHVHTQLESRGRTAHTDYLIDARTGAILKRWDTLHTEAVTGLGLTQYNGTVKLNEVRTPKGYALRDQTRGKGGTFGNNVITNLDHATAGNGALVLNPDPDWGDHGNYTGADLSTTSPTGQTAMADAAYGAQVTWDLYKNVFGRNGIDGKGTATFSRVHYDTSFDNAFWDDTCFCMTYGDGSQMKSLEALDVAGHEMSHGVCASTANLAYTGESGGLNEANSDIFGTMAEFYSKGGGYQSGARTLPEKGGNWTLGEQIMDPPLRYMYKPSKDGSSPDEWSDSLAALDVHFSSGPMNRCFYFLSQGATEAEGDRHTGHLPLGMKGLGNQRAARIWYRTLTTYLTSQSDYAAARLGTIRAAKDLYGAGSPEEVAVHRAFHGINVGKDWSPVTATILHPATDVAVVAGTRVSFQGSAEDTAPGASLSYGWTFGDGGVAVGPAATHVYRNPEGGDAVYTATFNVLDDQGNQGTDTRSITVTQPPAKRPERIRNGGFEDGPGFWQGSTEVIGATDGEPPYAGLRNAVFTGIGLPTTQSLYQVVAIPLTTRSATLTFRLHIDSTQLPGIPLDYFQVQLQDARGTLQKELAAYSNTDANTGYALESFDLTEFRGRSFRLSFQASEGWLLHTTFALDNVSLIVK